MKEKLLAEVRPDVGPVNIRVVRELRSESVMIQTANREGWERIKNSEALYRTGLLVSPPKDPLSRVIVFDTERSEEDTKFLEMVYDQNVMSQKIWFV